MKKFIVFLMLLVLSLSILTFNTSALTVSTYSDVTNSTSQTTNLINCAIKYKSFNESKYVVFCDQQNSYYIVWGDLTYNGSKVSAAKVEYIHYYRPGGINTSFEYQYGTDSSFSLTPDNMCVSNIDDFGMASTTYEQYKSDAEQLSLMILVGSFLFVMMLIGLRSK